MNKKLITIISWILVIVWMGVIFSFSNMNGESSDGASKGTIATTIEKGIELTSKVGFTDKNLSEEKINVIAQQLNAPLRKVMHVTEYFILSLLLINALKRSNVDIKKAIIITIPICFLYACTDELHQMFIDSRSPSFIDTLIDTTGALIGCCIWLLVYKIAHTYCKKSKKNI